MGGVQREDESGREGDEEPHASHACREERERGAAEDQRGGGPERGEARRREAARLAEGERRAEREPVSGDAHPVILFSFIGDMLA